MDSHNSLESIPPIKSDEELRREVGVEGTPVGNGDDRASFTPVTATNQFAIPNAGGPVASSLNAAQDGETDRDQRPSGEIVERSEGQSRK